MNLKYAILIGCMTTIELPVFAMYNRPADQAKILGLTISQQYALAYIATSATTNIARICYHNRDGWASKNPLIGFEHTMHNEISESNEPVPNTQDRCLGIRITKYTFGIRMPAEANSILDGVMSAQLYFDGFSTRNILIDGIGAAFILAIVQIPTIWEQTKK